MKKIKEVEVWACDKCEIEVVSERCLETCLRCNRQVCSDCFNYYEAAFTRSKVPRPEGRYRGWFSPAQIHGGYLCTICSAGFSEIMKSFIEACSLSKLDHKSHDNFWDTDHGEKSEEDARKKYYAIIGHTGEVCGHCDEDGKTHEESLHNGATFREITKDEFEEALRD